MPFAGTMKFTLQDSLVDRKFITKGSVQRKAICENDTCCSDSSSLHIFFYV